MPISLERATNGFKSVAVEQNHKRKRAGPGGSGQVGFGI